MLQLVLSCGLYPSNWQWKGLRSRFSRTSMQWTSRVLKPPLQLAEHCTENRKGHISKWCSAEGLSPARLQRRRRRTGLSFEHPDSPRKFPGYPNNNLLLGLKAAVFTTANQNTPYKYFPFFTGVSTNNTDAYLIRKSCQLLKKMS